MIVNTRAPSASASVTSPLIVFVITIFPFSGVAVFLFVALAAKLITFPSWLTLAPDSVSLTVTVATTGFVSGS